MSSGIRIKDGHLANNKLIIIIITYNIGFFVIDLFYQVKENMFTSEGNHKYYIISNFDLLIFMEMFWH